MTTTDRDGAGLPEIAPEKPENAPRPRESYLRTPEPEIAPSGPEIPSRSSDSDAPGVATAFLGSGKLATKAGVTADERIASAVRSATRAFTKVVDKGSLSARITGVGRIATTDGVSEVVDDERRAFRDLIASLEAQLAEARDEATGLAHDRTAAEAAADTLTRKLADVTTDRDALREIIERKDVRIAALETQRQALGEGIERRDRDIAQLTIERDVAATNARRERDRADLFRETLLDVRDDLHNENRLNTHSIADVIWHGPAETTVDFIDVALDSDASKRRVRVVTSPRFYSEEQRFAALRRLMDFWIDVPDYAPIDAVAEALGMRRAQS